MKNSHKRSTSFGYGPKTDYIQLSSSPPVTRYNVEKSLLSLKKIKGGSFRIGRNQCKKVYQKEGFENTLDPDTESPGPAKYGRNQSFGRGAPKFSLVGKKKDHKFEFYLKNSPGPGVYNDPKSNEKYSKYSTAMKIDFGSKSKRFSNPNNFRNPGPGDYKLPSNLSRIGQELIGVVHGLGNQKFDVSERKTLKIFERDITPGPGSYSPSHITALPSIKSRRYPSQLRK
mmetsp:Transcript_25339/g.28102  ORF Transcript_25339/g.28102 Transcript_25339/m.28102 type:complete len:228 (+) Transcript_25339:78-761(+)